MSYRDQKTTSAIDRRYRAPIVSPSSRFCDTQKRTCRDIFRSCYNVTSLLHQISQTPEARVSDSREQAFGEPTESTVTREGLPRHYRMRADRHYVDQLDTVSTGQPVRM